MKKYSIYTGFVILLFLFLYYLNKEAPVQYRWQPTFNKHDKQPYGAYAFDKIMEASWEKGYISNQKGIMELDTEGTLDDYNLLIITSNFQSFNQEINTLSDYINRGGNALIVSDHFPEIFERTLNISTLSNAFFYPEWIDLTKKQPGRSLRLHPAVSNNKIYSFPSALCPRFIGIVDEDFIYTDSSYVISETMDNLIISMRFRMGKGNLILACNPLVYTNYGILNDSINEYIRYHLSYLQDRPLMRTTYYHSGSQKVQNHSGSKMDQNQSIFRYILSERSLRWAFYITLLCVLLFMFFTAKRKQKAIPIIKPPANRMLAFVRSIAGLYLLKNNNADIILKKQIYWAEELKKKYGIDIINATHDLDLYTRLASKTGQPMEDIRQLLIRLRSIDKTDRISDDEMMQLITKINVLNNI
jgi:hypothetical protein